MLKEQLHQEEIQRLLKEQSVSELQGRIWSLEESEKGLEAMVREKKEAILGESRTLEGPMIVLLYSYDCLYINYDFPYCKGTNSWGQG